MALRAFHYINMADQQGGYSGDGGGGGDHRRSRGFAGSSRGGYGGGPSRGGRHGGGAPWPGSGDQQQQQQQQRGQVGNFQHREQQFQHLDTSRQRRPPSPQEPGPSRPASEMSLLAVKSETGGHQASERAFRRGSGAAMRGGMRGRRELPDIVHTRDAQSFATKQGSTGKIVRLTTNYFRVNRVGDDRIHQYRVDFTPLVESSRKMSYLVSTLRKDIGGYLFEGTQIFSRNELCAENGTIEFTAKDRDSEEPHKIKLRRVGVIDGTNEMAFLIYNLINRKAMSGLQLQLIGRNYFDPNARIEIRQFGLEVFPGYLTSIRQHEQDVLMCTEIVHKVMRIDTCYGLFDTCMQSRGNFQDNYKKLVIGSVVMTTYGQNKTYRVNDVDFSITPQSTFETKTGPISFIQYFRDKYNVQIRDPKQPMLVSLSKPRDIRAGMPELVLLVPELSRITGLSDEMRQDFRLMRALADQTRLAPDRRIERLDTFNRRLQQSNESSEIFKFWKTELDRRLVEVQGRVLPQETIFFQMSDHNKVAAGERAEWQQAFRNNPMFRTVPLKRWVVVVPYRMKTRVHDFIGCMYQAAQGMSFEMYEPMFVEIPDDSPVTYVNHLQQIVQKDPQLIMCMVSNDQVDRYAAIKKKCCIDRAVPTQVIKDRTITPKGGNVRTLLSVATKVVIQLNCKLEGTPWVVKNLLPSVLIIGFDMCPDSKDKNKSYGAMVAAMHMDRTQHHPDFYSVVNEHKSGEEISNYMAINVVKTLRSYQERYKGALPKRVIIYRDGVGDGQLKYVNEHEVCAVREKLDQIYQAQNLEMSLTFIVVSKRINTRLFKNRQNPEPGTIVDDVITLPERNDFYLISQSVRQGTVSPTSYNILYDNSKMGADRLQQYTYKQTHMYYNWSGTVQVPAVCQYAHKLCFLTSQYLHRTPNVGLEKKLYFL